MKGNNVILAKARVWLLYLTNYNYYIFREYYQYKKSRLGACRMCFHYLLHVADSICECRPPCRYWQFPMERMCGMLLPLVNSRQNPFENLAKNLSIIEKFNYLKYLPKFSKDFQKLAITRVWNSNQVFGSLPDHDGAIVEFYWPSQECLLDNLELKHLQTYLNSIGQGQQVGRSCVGRLEAEFLILS